MGYGDAWVADSVAGGEGYSLWAMGYSLWAMGYGPFRGLRSEQPIANSQ
jgi:hypothetical protein